MHWKWIGRVLIWESNNNKKKDHKNMLYAAVAGAGAPAVDDKFLHFLVRIQFKRKFIFTR